MTTEAVNVSIHAPARGATFAVGSLADYFGFNSRAREGRDRLLFARSRLPKSFNSRAREGRDAILPSPLQSGQGFNSRAREGRDRTRNLRRRHPRSFNSRAREGRDVQPRGTYSRWRRFNSRAREGRDRGALRTPQWQRVSIHAPARGATPCINPTKAKRAFQFTRPRGARHGKSLPNPILKGFNSRAREGRDILPIASRFDGRVSIHAPARGATSPGRFRQSRSLFQFTRPRGARHRASRSSSR